MDAALLDGISTAIRSVSKRSETMMISPDSRLVEDLALDSLDLVGVLMKLEDHYEITIELDDVPNVTTVAELGGLVDSLRAGRSAAA